jgi:hypothetical protein
LIYREIDQRKTPAPKRVEGFGDLIDLHIEDMKSGGKATTDDCGLTIAAKTAT